MPDNTPRNWSEAFAALPQEAPPAKAWERVSAGVARTGRGFRHSWMGLAAAAALVAILVAPWERRHADAGAADVGAAEAAIASAEELAASAAPTSAAPTSSAPAPRLDDLYAESARLEALLALARDERVANASAALVSYELDARVVAIDASLARPDLGDDERLQLWQARVDALRRAAGFETTQRLLASQGRSDAMLVGVD